MAIQTPGVLVVLVENLSFRQIFLDGRALPNDPDPSFMGYSTGHWDGDTLVVESTGFKDRMWLDVAGHPHTEALRIPSVSAAATLDTWKSRKPSTI